MSGAVYHISVHQLITRVVRIYFSIITCAKTLPWYPIFFLMIIAHLKYAPSVVLLEDTTNPLLIDSDISIFLNMLMALFKGRSKWKPYREDSLIPLLGILWRRISLSSAFPILLEFYHSVKTSKYLLNSVRFSA